MNSELYPSTNPALNQVRNLPAVRGLLSGGGLRAPVFPGDPGLPAADVRFEGELRVIRGVPGTSASKVYVCLADDADPAVYSWVEVASG